jgi:hypothetical protein
LYQAESAAQRLQSASRHAKTMYSVLIPEY